MRYTSEISRDGPYIRVLLPDVLPPDWEAIRRELKQELDEGASRVLFVLGECPDFTPQDTALVQLVSWLVGEGVDAVAIPYGNEPGPSTPAPADLGPGGRGVAENRGVA